VIIKKKKKITNQSLQAAYAGKYMLYFARCKLFTYRSIVEMSKQRGKKTKNT